MRVVLLYNPYDWLPLHGESGIDFTSEGLHVKILISYESEASGNPQTSQRSFVFHYVKEFCEGLCPGPTTFKGLGDYGAIPLTALVELVGSPEASAWNEHLSSKKIKHFQIYFRGENRFF